jgi:dihydrofolate reductase
VSLQEATRVIVEFTRRHAWLHLLTHVFQRLANDAANREQSVKILGVFDRHTIPRFSMVARCASVAHDWRRHLYDEVQLLVAPVLLGKGKRFFSENAPPRVLALVTTVTASSGAMLNTYRPVGPLRTGAFADETE